MSIGDRSFSCLFSSSTHKENIMPEEGLSDYARLFDETNFNWKNDAHINLILLQAQEQYANHMLNRDGFLFLNDVYLLLGFERTSIGQLVGWMKTGDGAGYIDFGLHEKRNQKFMHGEESSVWLDFNVDGEMYNKIDKET